jgi:pimeloyl-ACP methyl ester carboxylesterase
MEGVGTGKIPVMADGCVSQFITSHDGLKLHVGTYGSRTAPTVPVVCLPGLARTGDDFNALATALAGDPDRPRHVVTMDYRGRGRSDYDRNPFNYNFAIELADVLAVLTALDIDPAVFVGTSRGGILAMLLASARPAAIAGVVLNDIGPVIDVRGLARIKSYVGNLPEPKSFADGAQILRRLFASQFPKLSEDDWIAFSKRAFKQQGGRLLPTYDVRIAKTLERIDLERPLQSLWVEFDALAHMPAMVIRGANSDVLSAATVEAMRARKPDLDVIEVPDQGHAPLLVEHETIGRISSFVAHCERYGAHSGTAKLGLASWS